MPGLNLDVRSNLATLEARLDWLQRDGVPFATIYALTKTAQDIKDAEYQVMQQSFDRPTRFTLNSLYVQPATRQVPAAFVRFKEGFGSVPAWRYLGPEIEGGVRVKKSHERALERVGVLKPDEYVVPGAGVELDSYGNMKGSQLVQILSQLKASPDAGQHSTTSRRSKRTVARAGTYFVMRNGRVPDGIYRRQGRNLRPILIFVRQPRYQQRLPFRQTADAIFTRRFDAWFAAGLRKYATRSPIASLAA